MGCSESVDYTPKPKVEFTMEELEAEVREANAIIAQNEKKRLDYVRHLDWEREYWNKALEEIAATGRPIPFNFHSEAEMDAYMETQNSWKYWHYKITIRGIEKWLREHKE